jgi:crotonobetainyl-CoA:carnitine CoA-transferase CaiB-like acyl-CoA transferase
MTEHPQVTAREVYEEIPHPLYRALPYSRIPLRITGPASEADTHAPLWGEHNEYVFAELLGLSQQEIQRLYDEGVTAHQPDLA